MPVLTEGTAMIVSYLTIERERGRIAADADVSILAPTLIGAGHLLFADRESPRRRLEPFTGSWPRSSSAQGGDHGVAVVADVDEAS
ncbi:hypothetical protein ACNPQM_09995 [Streptomyces sp. NPDC056231]|uniref:hypothetical protein n=1 Tax=Streptomyces sp. NPDC056231 TaxID=3345755 RepID=UPI003AAE47A7